MGKGWPVPSRISLYVLVILQHVLYFFVVFFLQFPMFTGSRVDGALKVLFPSHFWVLLFSIALSIMFYRVSKLGRAEKLAFVGSLGTALLSTAYIGLHFVDGHDLLMRGTDITAALFYVMLLITAIVKILAAYLTAPSQKR